MKFGCNYLPQRYVLAFMSFLGITIFYAVRTSLRITLRKLSTHNQTLSNGSKWVQFDKCFEKLHKLNDHEQQQILVTFYYGYALCHIPGALLVKRFGGKIVFALGAAAMSLLTFVLPFAACYSKYTLIAVRTSYGVAMSVFFSSATDLLSRWAPSNERTLLSATVFAGSQVGVVNTWMLPWFLLDLIKWQNMYFILGVVGIIWCFLWSILCYNSPNDHPFLTDGERKFLKKYILETDQKKPTPWMAIIKSKPVWALIIATFGHCYGFYTIIVNLPKYYNDDSKISYSKNGDLAVLPFLLMWLVSVVMGFLSDKIIYLKWTSTTQLRRILATIGAVGPGIGMVSSSYLSDNVSKVVLITMFMSSMSFSYSSLRVNPLDLTRNHSALIMALASNSGAIAGIVAPAVVESILAGAKFHSFTEIQRQWQDIYWVMFTVLVITNIPFMMYGSGELQKWDMPDKLRPRHNYPRTTSNTS